MCRVSYDAKLRSVCAPTCKLHELVNGESWRLHELDIELLRFLLRQQLQRTSTCHTTELTTTASTSRAWAHLTLMSPVRSLTSVDTHRAAMANGLAATQVDLHRAC